MRIIIKNNYLSLGLYASDKQWSKEASLFKKDKRLNPNYVEDNGYIILKIEQAQQLVKDFEKKRIDFTFYQFKEQFLGIVKKGNVKAFFESQITDLEDTGRIGNANCYKAAYNMLKLFDKKFASRVFSEIDYNYIVKFDKFLQKPRLSEYHYKSENKRVVNRDGCSGNTRRYYLKALRAVLNKAIKAKEASRETYPFGENGFELSKLEEETVKRYLPTEHIINIMDHVSDKRTCEFGRQLFLFAFYAYGMSFIDMALLDKNKNIRLDNDGYCIVYKRYKLRNNKKAKYISIKITPEIQALIDGLNKMQPAVGNYLLPIITDIKTTERKKYEHIKNMLKKFNGYLDKLADEMELKNIHVTSYVSRHSMAMSMQNSSADTKLISQMLGHNKLETTITYLDSFSNEEISRAAESGLYLKRAM